VLKLASLEVCRIQISIFFVLSFVSISILGSSLFLKFESLGDALQYAYPEFDWDLSKFSMRGTKAGQRWLRALIEELLPGGTEIVEDYHHPELVWGVCSGVNFFCFDVYCFFFFFFFFCFVLIYN
jgi:hypothetical protein